MLPLWIRRLPHNLSTVGLLFSWKVDVLDWGLYMGPRLKLNRGDKDYPVHYEKGPYLLIHILTLQVEIGFKDTPEENAWIP